MRKTYHYSLSSHEEVMFRNQSDLTRAFNCFALAVLETESRALADAEMSSHVHFCAQTDYPKDLMRRYRYGYTRYFNSKYERKGRLGERKYFLLEVDGIRHVTCCLSYVMRQSLHHGLTSTPFEYNNCSINTIFRKELGKAYTPTLIKDSSRYLYLPEGAHDFRNIRMNSEGMLLREDVIDCAYVEEIYVTPRNFLYQMNRLSDETWIEEQQEENRHSPLITLDSIESGMTDISIQIMKLNEKGRINKSILTDMELCQLIDNYYLPLYYNGIKSIYQLPERSRAALANRIWKDFKNGGYPREVKDLVSNKQINEKQLRRCLVLPRNG